MLAALAALAWCSLAYIADERPGTDSGVYLTGGRYLLAGKVLYRDLWDHKPPGIYVLNAVALAFASDRTSWRPMRIMERGFAALGAVAFFLVVLRALGSRLLAGFAAFWFVMHFENPKILQFGGNWTEEYASVFVLLGILATMHGREGRILRQAVLCALSGLAFSTATFIKEPFVLGSLAWFALLAVGGSATRRARILRAAAFLAGAVLPLIAVVSYFAAHGALGDWLAAVEYNSVYAGMRRQRPAPEILLENARVLYLRVCTTSVAAQVAFVLGVVASVRHGSGLSAFGRWFPVLAAADFLANFVATSLSARFFEHYYMQNVASYLLVAATGVMWLVRRTATVGVPARRCMLVFVLLACLLDRRSLAALAQQLTGPVDVPGAARCVSDDRIAAYILRHSRPGDTIWAADEHGGRVYMQTGRDSPTRYLYVMDHLFIDTRTSSRRQKLDVLRGELARRMPEFVLLRRSHPSVLRTEGFVDWIHAHYRPCGVWERDLNIAEEIGLYVRKRG
jgi:hypothetical protein